MALRDPKRTYVALPRYPVVERDLALVCEEAVTADTLKAAISRAEAGVLIENVNLFDVFRGGSVPAGKKSMAYSFTLRAEERTLNEEDIERAIAAILKELKKEGTALRS